MSRAVPIAQPYSMMTKNRSPSFGLMAQGLHMTEFRPFGTSQTGSFSVYEPLQTVPNQAVGLLKAI